MFARLLAVSVLLWLFVSHFLISTWQVGSVSMSPTLRPSDRLVTSPIPFGVWIPFTSVRLPGVRLPARGDLVVVEPPFVPVLSSWRRLLEPVVAFLSFQRATLSRDIDGARFDRSMVKRVIGIPGDVIKLQGFIAYVRPRGAAEFVPEGKLIALSFERRIEVPQAPGDPSPSFTGAMSEIRLGDDQYFVLGDNRSSSSDSRSWGPVSLARIQARVLFRYWPLSSLGPL